MNSIESDVTEDKTLSYSFGVWEPEDWMLSLEFRKALRLMRRAWNKEGLRVRPVITVYRMNNWGTDITKVTGYYVVWHCGPNAVRLHQQARADRRRFLV